MDYSTLKQKLGNRPRRKLGNNTYTETRDGGAIVIRLHDTDVLTFHPDGRTVVTSGDWQTVTTKARLNEYLPHGWSISQRQGIWYWDRLGVPFTDGDSIAADGTLRPQAKPDGVKHQQKLRRAILNYAKLCAAAVPLAIPSGGDCWHCAMTTEDGQSLGDACQDTSHLQSHMDEEYVVPSLVFRALKERGATSFILASTFTPETSDKWPLEVCRDAVKRAVTKYLRHRFGLPA